MSVFDWRRRRTNVSKLYYHLIFTTKYRRRVLTSGVLSGIEIVMRTALEDVGGQVLEFNGEIDHVHILAEIPPSVSVSNAVGLLKFRSSSYTKTFHKSALRSLKWSSHLWTPGYCAVTCGGAPLEILERYIRDQDRPD